MGNNPIIAPKKKTPIYLYVPMVLGLLIIWSSCRKDLLYAPSAGNLEFSQDTVYLDTIFTNIGSSTYTLKVYNRTRDDIEIPSIRLAKGENSDYRLNVDGVAGKTFLNIPVFAQDSLFILIETTHDISTSGQNSLLYTDAINFDTEDDLQTVQLVTLVKDAIFLYPRTLADGKKQTIPIDLDDEGNEVVVEGFFLEDDELNFTKEKPYVIYGYAAVPQNKALVIEAGSRVYFHKDSGILVSENASLKVNGALSANQEVLENEVIFEGDRLEPEFDDIPGQWGTIWLSEGSNNNSIDYLTLKNATIGIFVEGYTPTAPPTLTMNNSRIYNSASVNLWGAMTSIVAANCVLGSAGNISLYCSIGGDYSFTHSTIANYWQNGFRSGSALELDNYNLGQGEISADLVRAEFLNCIIDGNTNLELSLRSNGANTFNYHFSHCMIKFKDSNGNFAENPFYDFQNATLYEQPLLNEDADFWNAKKQDFRIGEASFGKAKAASEYAVLVPFDILGIDRSASPDIGAFQNMAKDQ